MSGHENAVLWTEEALHVRPEWALVRSLAVDTLAAFDWDVAVPPPNPDAYIPAGPVDES